MTGAEIAARLGLRLIPGQREWRGACPACGYAAAFILSQRDGRPLWRCVSCADRGAVTGAVRAAMASDWQPPPLRPAGPPPASVSSRTDRARALWAGAVPVPGTPAATYLAARGLAGIVSTALRFHPNAPHPHGLRLPTMVAAIRCSQTGSFRAVHRTYLRPDGCGKADIEPAKASLGPVAGGAVMLDQPRDGEPLVIGEGIETAASAALLLGGAGWSAISAGNLAALELPRLPACKVVVIAADPDPPGQRAADAAACRWRAEGRRVRIATPSRPGSDFNDVLRDRSAARETFHAR